MGLAVGLMSGTSLDGIDVAMVDIKGSGLDTELTLIDFMTVPFDDDVREKIMMNSSVSTSDVKQICSLNFQLGQLFADATVVICTKNGVDVEDLDFIGSHGQTIHHLPISESGFVSSTLQIGEPAVIAFRTNTLVVSNFRTMDIAAKGQGAPLVPYTEWILYRHEKKGRLLQNIGGIGNVTVMPANATLESVTAFDTGPGNMVIDELVKRLFGVPYDSGGKLAAKGCVDDDLLSKCMSHPYFLLAPPKSTGRELFGAFYVDQLLLGNEQMNPYDLVATMTMFTAKTIAFHYEKYIFPHHDISEIIVSGGGSYNTTLIAMLTELLSGTCCVSTGEDIGFSSEAKEAIAFAILANETIHGNPSNVKSATGASENVLLGNITYPPRKNKS